MEHWLSCQKTTSDSAHPTQATGNWNGFQWWHFCSWWWVHHLPSSQQTSRKAAIKNTHPKTVTWDDVNVGMKGGLMSVTHICVYDATIFTTEQIHSICCKLIVTGYWGKTKHEGIRLMSFSKLLYPPPPQSLKKHLTIMLNRMMMAQKPLIS